MGYENNPIINAIIEWIVESMFTWIAKYTLQFHINLIERYGREINAVYSGYYSNN